MWEPHPWDLNAPAAGLQRQGFEARAGVLVDWQRIAYDDLLPAGLFGLTRDELISADAVCHATLQGEHWLLIQLVWHGFPDPPEWGLWTRPQDAADVPWQPWGFFDPAPPAWRLPPEPVRSRASVRD